MERKTINKAITYGGKTQAEIAQALGMTAANLSNRLNKCRFSADELRTIAEAMGAEYVEFFQFPDGVKIF